MKVINHLAHGKKTGSSAYNSKFKISSGPNLINWQEDYSIFHPQSSDDPTNIFSPLSAWHISCGLQIWWHLSKTRHSSIYWKRYIKKILSMFSVGGLGAYMGRFGDFASYKVHLWPKRIDWKISQLLELRLSHGLQANLIYIGLSVYTWIHNLAGYKEDMMPFTVSGMLYFMQLLWALCALRTDLTKKMDGS